MYKYILLPLTTLVMKIAGFDFNNFVQEGFSNFRFSPHPRSARKVFRIFVPIFPLDFWFPSLWLDSLLSWLAILPFMLASTSPKASYERRRPNLFYSKKYTARLPPGVIKSIPKFLEIFR